jgi:peroxin-12
MDYFSSLNANSLDPDTPTLFELLSAHQLQDLISPSLRYIVTFYAQRHPQYLLKLANRYDELYMVVMGLVEYYHLKNWNASFTEKFYGLKRTRVLTTNALGTRAVAPQAFERHRRLSNRQVWGSVFLVIVAPYLKEKLDARYEVLKGRYMFRTVEQDRIIAYQGPVSARLQFEVDRWLLRFYPTLTMAENVVSLGFYLLFLFSKTTKSGVADLVLGMKYSRLSQIDYQMMEEAVPLLKEPDQPLGNRIAQLLITGQGLKAIKNSALSGLSYALPTSMFLLKFLEWWHASDFARQMSKKARGGDGSDDSLPLPLPPKTTMSHSANCPLCGQPMANPTAIETGAVFCYLCIYRHLEDGDKDTGGRCPVTGQKLLGCKYSEVKSGWEVGGLRRLVV